MYTEIRLVFEKDFDKVYIFFAHPFFYEGVKRAINDKIEVFPQILQQLVNDTNKSILLQIKKGTFPAVYDLFQRLALASEKFEKMTLDDMKLAAHWGTTDEETLRKIKEMQRIIGGGGPC